MVLFSHSFPLTGNPEPMVGSVTLGTIGVWIFFILSGYLISISWDQYPRFNVFFAKRSLRIFPGLSVNILLTLIVTGLFFSGVTFAEFLASSGGIDYLNNLLLYPVQLTIFDTFSSNPMPNAVNGSLWTLLYEFTMYIAIAFIGTLGVYRKIKPIFIWATLFILSLAILFIGQEIFAFRIFFFELRYLIILGLLFFSGVMFHKYKDRIVLDPLSGLNCLLIFITASVFLPDYLALFGATLLAYSLFSLGSLPYLSFVKRLGDLSYGIYIYSFPVQQMVIASTGSANPLKVFVVSGAIVLVLSYVSWHLIEARTLKLKSSIRLDKYPLSQTNEAW